METAEKNAHRITYRIRGIPVACTEDDLGLLLKGALALQDDNQLQIRSFSSDVSFPGDIPSRTAIVSFRAIPPPFAERKKSHLRDWESHIAL